ncbi:GNAT family N-acetyltransferase [Streptomyces sp. NPDC049577]|uniref:GNAT family N-acetyltransferase n=1 Tax=Streptomyces sp. NPDC049577 TaxID=3155153 RepID=UPI00341EF6E3
MDVTSLGYRTDLMLRVLAGSEIVDHGSHLVVRTPANPAYRWGNFVLFDAPPGPDDAARWAEVFAREFPGATYAALGVDGTGGATGDAEAHARLGVTATVDTVLTTRQLWPPARPRPHVTVRALAGDEDWAQAAKLRLACAGAPLPDEHRRFLEDKLAEYRRLCEAGHGAWFGAFADGRMRAGAGLFTDGDGLARFQDVETHPGFRRRGLATALVHDAGWWGLKELGARTLVIVADPGYHAIHLYRALGFRDAERQVRLHRDPVL